MSLRALLESWMGRPKVRKTRSGNRFAVETLEDRLTPAAFFTISDATILEGNTGTANLLVQVRLTEPHGNACAVNYSTANGSALAGSDFNAVSGTLTFAKNELTKNVVIPIRGDRLAESAEYFSVQLSNAKGAKIADPTAIVNITDNEPRISITGWSESEGNAGTKEFTFNVSLSSAYDQAVSVDFTTANSSALAGSDFVANNGTLTFLPNQPTTQSITVVVNGDLDAEYDESFYVNLSNASGNAQFSNSSAVGNIYNDEPMVNIYETWFYYDSNYMVFTVTLSAAPTDAAITVDYTTWDGSAVAGYDYVFQSGTLTFDIGETVEYIYVDILNFSYTDLYFSVQLSNASPPAQLANSSANGYWYYDYGYYYSDWGYDPYYYGW